MKHNSTHLCFVNTQGTSPNKQPYISVHSCIFKEHLTSNVGKIGIYLANYSDFFQAQHRFVFGVRLVLENRDFIAWKPVWRFTRESFQRGTNSFGMFYSANIFQKNIKTPTEVAESRDALNQGAHYDTEIISYNLNNLSNRYC